MSLRLVYPYPEWVHKARYPKGYNVLAFHAYNDDGCSRQYLMRFLTQGDNGIFSQALLLKQFPFPKCCDSPGTL